ncbi:Holliday junction branch migration protein RuvA [Chlamydiifrater phoenicopteri]|uniref:Holliday junction branch migration protein RuvA n=1 Tax=Chlamydiifrater phoenicopteri TaxID=2681469 RepID=UPI001BCB4886|nr:Holliday junction branch migration protein RuvA [Chlamydiifrater phoenicopteri]
MFEYIRGKLSGTFPSYLVIDVNGLGYCIHVPERLSIELSSKIEQEVVVFVHSIVRETEHVLYGFSSKEERECFRLLMASSGIGPKLACSILNSFSLSNLSAVVRSEDSKTIASVPGLGKKTAEKLMVDLKEKLPALIQSLGGLSGDREIFLRKTGSCLKDNGISALISLGYSKISAEKMIAEALQELPEEDSLEKIIPVALKKAF